MAIITTHYLYTPYLYHTLILGLYYTYSMDITKDEQKYIIKMIAYTEMNGAIMFDDISKQEKLYKSLSKKLS